MGLKERVEVMHTLDQLSDDQYANLISQLFARDRTTTNQLLSRYFATNNNPALATKIKDTAKLMLHVQDPGDEPVSQSVMSDPHILSNIALFLPIRQIVCLESLSRRSFISLRNYPAIHALSSLDIDRFLRDYRANSLTVDMNRLRNVRDLDLGGVSVATLTEYVSRDSHPIFKNVQKLELDCWDSFDVLPKVMSLCDMSEVKWLSFSADIINSMISSEAKDFMTLILSCRKLTTLILRGLDTSSAECMWTVKEVRDMLPDVRVLQLKECDHRNLIEILFEALSPQIHSLHLCEMDGGALETVKLSGLLQRNTDIRNLRELCWCVYDGKDFLEGVSGLIVSEIDNLERLYFYNKEMDGFTGAVTEEAKRNIVDLFKRNWSHIELVDEEHQLSQDLVCCLKKGLLQRQGGGNLFIALPIFIDTENAEMDMLDIIGIINMRKVEEFAVVRRCEPDKQIFDAVSDSVTITNTYENTCCRSVHYKAMPWIYTCNNCSTILYTDLL